MSTQGNPSKYNFAFAEAANRSPWEPYHVSMGFKRNEGVIAIFGGGWSHSGNFSDVKLDTIPKSIALYEWPDGAIILMDPRTAKAYSG